MIKHTRPNVFRAKPIDCSWNVGNWGKGFIPGRNLAWAHAIRFWDLYAVVNQQQSKVADAWDGSALKLTSRRTVPQI
jgi:hypothetical protein